jgi:hypothetical protein
MQQAYHVADVEGMLRKVTVELGEASPLIAIVKPDVVRNYGNALDAQSQ